MGDKKPSKKLIVMTVILCVYAALYIAMIVDCIVKCEIPSKSDNVSSSVEVTERQDTVTSEDNGGSYIFIAMGAVSLVAIITFECISRSEDKRLLREEERRRISSI